jgi:hypothetical protein
MQDANSDEGKLHMFHKTTENIGKKAGAILTLLMLTLTNFHLTIDLIRSSQITPFAFILVIYLSWPIVKMI